MDEFRQLNKALAQSPSAPVLIDKNTFALVGWYSKNRGIRELVELIQNRYEIAVATKSSYLFARRPDNQLLLDGKENGDSCIFASAKARPWLA